jgi:hypothetical protein
MQGDLDLKINSVHDLLRLYDADFLAAAYETLLGRRLDIDGVRSYLNLLREGHDREFVIYALATSPEGLQFQSDLDGLPQFLKLQQRLRRSPLAIFLRVVYRLRYQRLQANRVESMIGCLESSIVRLESRITRLESVAQTLREVAVSTASPPNEDRQALRLIKSPRAREIFDRLHADRSSKG